MSLSPSALRVADPVITKVVQGIKDPELVGHHLFPIVPVETRSGRIIKFGPEDFMAYETGRARGANAKEVMFGYGNESYTLKSHGLDAKIPEEDVQDAQKGPGINLLTVNGQRTAKIVRRGMEKDQAALATNASNYGAGNKLTLSGTTKWSHANGTPLVDVDNAREVVRAACGVDPNVLMLSAVAWKALRRNAEVRAAFQFTSADKMPTPQQLAELLGVAQVVVGRGITADAAGALSDVWGNNAILAYVAPPSAGAITQDRGEPSFGYTYELTPGLVVRKSYFDEPSRSHKVPVDYEAKPMLTGMAAGFLFQNPN